MFTVKSTKLSKNLERMRSQFTGINKLSFKLVVPPEMIWWFWQEFGTAMYAERGTKAGNEVGYDVPNASNGDAKTLRFYDRTLGQFRLAKHTFVFGIPAHHMVTDSLPEIELTIKASIPKAFREADYDLNKIHDILLTEMMPKIKEIIREAFATKLDLPSRPNGRLEQSAADEFEQKATIETNTFNSTY